MTSLYTLYYDGKRLTEIKADSEEHARQVGSIAYKRPVVALAKTAPAEEHVSAIKQSLFGALPLEQA